MYGTVLLFHGDLVNDSVFNGIRTARVEIKHDIPSTVRIVGEFIKFWYPGQPKSCRRCGDLDHFIKHCVNIRCFNCEQSGHCVEQCQERPMCSICHSTSHPLRNCPYLLYSVNVEPVSLSKSVSNSYVLSPPFYTFWSRKSCVIKFVNAGILKVSGSLEPAAFNLKSHSMLMMPRYLLKLNNLSVDFCKC